jgi:uncharacterized DUF497 family protein
MEIEYDEAKSQANFAKRKFNFVFAARVFNDTSRVEERDDRFDYGEDRFKVIGMIDGKVYMVVYTPRKSTLRIISARLADKSERKRYADAQV